MSDTAVPSYSAGFAGNYQCLTSDQTISGADMWWKSSEFNDPSIAFAACPFIKTKCSTNREHIFGTQTSTTVAHTSMQGGYACTYKIVAQAASGGAPGFNIETNADPNTFVVSWVEYQDLPNFLKLGLSDWMPSK